MTTNPPPGWYPNAQGQQQWWDGQKWGPIAPVQAPAKAVSANKTPSGAATTNKGAGMGCLVLLAIVIGVGAVAGISSWASNNDPAAKEKRERESAPYYAQSACKTAVKEALKSPTSAEFSDVQTGDTTSPFVVMGHVDAENSFGAKLRNTFTCKVEVEGLSTRIVDLKIG